MKILYIALKYDYGKKERGYSFEHYNFYNSLVKMENSKHAVVYFPFDEISLDIGRKEMNKKLLTIVNNEKPDLCFFFLFTDEVYPETIKKITDSGVLTYNWFADDHWRFEVYSKYFAPNFSWVSTTDSKAVNKYKNIGYKNIIHTQWACNHFTYKPLKTVKTYDVSFVGQPHSDRRKIINYLEQSKIKVDCFGDGWSNGRVSQEKMLDIFSASKINLNLTKSSGGVDMVSLAKIFISQKNNKIMINPPLKLYNYFKSFLGRRREQIKGRNFEIPGCGGFLLSGYADNISDYYIPDKEMVFFKDQKELIDKVKYYLANDQERELIRKAGFDRTLRDHTYEKRFIEIFKIIGLYGISDSKN